MTTMKTEQQQQTIQVLNVPIDSLKLAEWDVLEYTIKNMLKILRQELQVAKKQQEVNKK
ncbi:MAG TPA: hypothetical protein VFP49_09940 [Nitrososphaeraceae archaeon]|nr:hypothetical protein [Nitrososphaeraceae archaeon]